MWWILAAIAALAVIGKSQTPATATSAQPQTQFLPILGGTVRTAVESPVNRGSSLNLFGGNPSQSPVGGPILLYPKFDGNAPSAPAAAGAPSGGGGGTPSGGIGAGPSGLSGLGGHRALL